jgi:hypothetical protein
MGFSFRGKNKPRVGDGVTTLHAATSATGSDNSNDDLANATAHLKKVKDQHLFDPFMSIDKIDAVDAALQSGDVEKEAAVKQSILLDDSPYMEVRAAVCILTICRCIPFTTTQNCWFKVGQV